MLRYLGTGIRNYEDTPVLVGPRTSWEFQAIIKGRAAPLFPESIPPSLPAGRRLWIFPPGELHGWTSDRMCEVVVFQITRVPEVVSLLYPTSSYVDLEPRDLRELVQLGQWLKEELRRPGPRLEALEMILQGNLTMLALRNHEQEISRLSDDHAARLIERAMGWLDIHMHEGVGLNEMAQAMQISVSHLRRLFEQVRGVSPREAIAEMRQARAETLLASKLMTQERVARACGFGSVQAFSRFFRARHARPPGNWQAKQIHHPLR